MAKIWYDGDIKKIDHGDWEEWIWPSGFRYTEGNIPEDEQMEFYGRYNPAHLGFVIEALRRP